MKYLVRIVLIFSLTTVLASCSNKLKFKNIDTEIYFENNEANNYRHSKLENYVRHMVEAKILNFDDEVVNSSLDILDTKEKAAVFAKQIAIFQFPQHKEAIEKYECETLEDKTSRMWFVKVRLSEMGFDNVLKLLILKKNCKIILLANTF